MTDKSKTKAQLISELGELRKHVARSEAYMESVLKAAPIGIGLVKNRVLEWLSDRMSEMLGYSQGELVGESARVAYESDEEFQRVGRVKYSQIKESGMGTLETRFKRKDGGALDVLLASSAIDSKDLSRGVIFTAMDITERKLAEEELRESEQRYSSLFKNNHSVMLLIDPVSADIVDANPAACNFYGWSQEELTSMKITDINMLPKREIFQEMERAKSEKRNHFYFRHRLANEKIRDVEVYSGPIGLDGKELLYSIIHDISERKQMEEELRESEHYFRSLLFNMHDKILVVDPDYRITDVNNTLLVAVGRKYEEVVGRHCYEVSHGYNEPCDKKGEDCKLREVFETGEPRSCRHQHKLANGSKFWVDILLSPLRNGNGSVTHVIEAIRNVTDLIEIEEELRESEENFRALADNANDGILIAAGEGIHLYANKRIAELTGFSVAELLEIGLHELVAPDEVDKVADRYKRRISGKSASRQYETTLVRKSGEIFPVELSGARSLWKGEPASIVIIRDITKKKKRESALRKSEAKLLEKSRHLEEVNAALKVLLKRREQDKEELGENVLSNVRQLVFPFLEKLKRSQLDTRQITLVDILESNIKEIVSPFVTKLSSKFMNLTPTEIKVASLIRDGRTTKEIAALLRLSENTIVFHRYNIRSKLRLKNQKVNLRSYLKSLHQ